ncbi:MAG: transposase [Bacteroidetes bacterium]|nr:transposase [Bacteroidota bacterium]
MSTREICRELGVTEATFYNWKAKYGASCFLRAETICASVNRDFFMTVKI